VREGLVGFCELDVYDRSRKIQIVPLGQCAHRKQHASRNADSDEVARRHLLTLTRIGAINGQAVVMRFFDGRGVLIAIVGKLQ
jgi:hypothetical protein